MTNANSSHPFETGEMTIPALDANAKAFMERRSACIFDDHLHTVNILSSGQFWLNHLSLDLRQMLKKDREDLEGTDRIDPEYLNDNSQWKLKLIANHALPEGFARSAGLTHNSSNMFCFFAARYFSTDYVDLQVAAYHPSTTKNSQPVEGYWEAPIPLQFPDDAVKAMGEVNIAGDNGGISATAFGEHQIIVALSYPVPHPHTISTIFGPSTHIDRNQSILLLLLDTRDIEIGKSTAWKARAYRTINLAVGSARHQQRNGAYRSDAEPLDRLHVESSRVCSNVDIDWFVMAPGKGSVSDQPEYRLAMNFMPGGASTHSDGFDNPIVRPLAFSTSWQLPLKPDGSGEIDDRPGYAFADANPVYYMLEEGVESDLRRDPSGRLRRFSGPAASTGTARDSHIGSIFTATDILPDWTNGFGTKDREHTICPDPQYATIDRSLLPAGAFYPFTQGKTERTIDKGKSNEHTITDVPVLEFLLYGDCKFQVRQYGLIRTVRYAKEVKQHLDDPTFVIGGYFDSAIPFPRQNFIDQIRDKEQIEVGSMRYLVEDKVEGENSVSTDWSVGYENSGKSTKGFGAAWDVEIKTGMSSVSRDSLEHSTGRDIKVSASVKKPEGEEIVAEGDGSAGFLDARFHFKCYQFFDAGNNLINDALTQDPALSAKVAEQIITMHTSKINARSFKPYVVEPGNLESYTAEAINEKMQSLGYEGSHYVADEIEANALSIGDGRKPLSFTWSEGNPTGTFFEQIMTTFREQGWTFDSKLYAGVSGGEEFSIFGFGEEAEMEVMGGVNFAMDRSSAETKTRKWGLEMESENWGPRSSEREDGVAHYSFDVYFLPVPDESSGKHPTHWAKELQAYLPKEGYDLTRSMIDPNSACWRVAFVVTEITYRQPNGSTRVNYPNALGD